MDKKQFILSTIPRMAQYTFPYLTSIIGVIDQQTGRHFGSGLRCMHSGRRAVITASHVIDEATRNGGTIAVSAGYGRAPLPMSGRVERDSVGDLAVYYVPDDYPCSSDVLFWVDDQIDRIADRLATDYLFVHGFPGERSQFFRLVQGIASKSLPYGVMQRLNGLPADLESWQFAMDYDPGNMQGVDVEGNEQFVDPHGLSGSPVWRIGISGGSAAAWTPNSALLVGFLTEWRPKEKVLIASLASRVFPSELS